MTNMSRRTSYKYQCKFSGPDGTQKMYKNKRLDHMTIHLKKIGKISRESPNLTEENFATYYTKLNNVNEKEQNIRRSRRIIETQIKVIDLAYDEKLNTSRAETACQVMMENNKAAYHKKNIIILQKKQKAIEDIIKNCREEKKKPYMSYL